MTKNKKRKKSRIPNILTISRIVISPLFILLLTRDEKQIGIAIFFIAFLTDILDGVIARKTNSITVFGIFADPIADKILLHSAFIYLVFASRLHPFVESILVGRDFLITGFRLIATQKGAVIEASPLGKIKTVLEVLLASFYLFYETTLYSSLLLLFNNYDLEVIIRRLLIGLTYIVLAAAAVSAAQIMIKNRKYLSDQIVLGNSHE